MTDKTNEGIGGGAGPLIMKLYVVQVIMSCYWAGVQVTLKILIPLFLL